MMFSGSKGANARSVLKWIWRNDSSLTTRFLNNVSPEVELSEYRGIPSPGSESPSGLLNGESVNSEQIADLDFFFERLYSYYCDKGLWCIITKWVVELLSLGFTICFSGFFLLFIDWNGLRNAKCGMDAVESGTKPCDLSKEAILKHPLTPLTLSKAIIMGYLGIFSIYWIICFLRFFTQLRDILQIRHFYYSSLHVTDDEIKTMPWATILEKVVQLQNMEQLCVVKDLTAHDVVMRLMRKENYLIGMLNKGVLAFPIYQWVPGAGPNVKSVIDGSRCCLILTKTLEWTLNWCILQSMFDRNFCVRRDFISDPRTLKRRLMVVGLVMLLLSPFLVIFMLVYLFLRHAEQFYNHPSTASSRRWSNLSRWIFREFNEVDHLFKHRINSSVVHASEYLKQFPSPIISIIAKFISFVFGGFAALLIIVAFTDESLLEGHLWGRNLLWYAAVCGTVTAISRAAIPEELLVLDPEGAMSMVVQHTHYMPKRWRSKENTGVVRAEFETLFQYTGMMLLEEMASIFLTPFLLMLVVPKRVDDILQFIADFTVNIEGVGHVCSFSVFDFQKHGNNNYGSPYNSPRNDRSSQGKMEKSFLSFQSVYPSWEPNAEGKQFLSNLTTVRDRMFQGNGARHPHSPSSLGGGESNNFFAREIPHQIPGLPYHLDTLLMINNADGRSRNLYLLDWYYTRRLHDHDNNNNYVRDHHRIIQEEPLENLGERQPEGYWVPPDFTSSQTHLGVSTAIPSFRGSVLRHNDESSSNVGRNSTTRSHWWDRSGPQGTHHHPPQASFLEPPDFNRTMPNDYYDHFSERSSEGEEQHLDWRNYQKLSRTMYVDDTEEVGEFNLHFDDIYRPEEGTS